VRVDFEPWDNFRFCDCENEHYSEETGKFVALNKNTSMTVRDSALLLVLENRVNNFLCYKDSGSISPNRKGKCGRKRKNTPRTNQILLRNSRLHPTMTSKERTSRDLLTSGIDTHASTVWRMLLEVGAEGKETNQKAIFDTCYEAKAVGMGK
jgi:hypothetical protein